MSSRFLLLLMLALPGLCSAQAGRFLLAVGDVVVARGAAEIRAGVGTPVESGDTIRVGVNSNAQVRLSDESIIGLRPGTVLRIDEYAFPASSDGRSIFSLLKGGFRTVTGVIGRLQARDRYAVRTPTATVGIRGTHYTLVHCDNDCEASPTASGGQTSPGGGPANGTYGGVSDGRIAVENQTGERLFGANEYFHVASQNTAPQGLIAPPSFLYDRLSGQDRNKGQKGSETSENMAQSGVNAESRPSDTPTPPTPNEFVVTEQRTATGESTVVGSRFDTAGLAAWISGGFDDSTAGGALLNQSQFTLGAGGQLQSITVPPGCIGPNEECNHGISASLGSPSQFSSATFPSSTQKVFWGAWANGTFVDGSNTITLSTNQQAHFLYAPLTPGEVMASKSGTLVLNNSTFPGGLGTTPTNNFGQLASGGSMPQLTVNFTAQNVASTSWSVNFPSGGTGTQNWSFPAGSGTLTLHPSGAFFLINTIGTCTSAGTACNGIASFAAKGRNSAIFIGPAGDHAGVSISGAAGTSQFSGVRVYCPTC